MQRHIERINDGQIHLECRHAMTQSHSLTINDHVDCTLCDQLVFPAGLSAYKKTPTFNQDTLPKGLKRTHSTKKGVWAVINVVSGRVRYVVDYLDNKSTDLDPHTQGIIAPQMEHHLDVIGDVELFVEFYTD